jgi:hypothetical protein
MVSHPSDAEEAAFAAIVAQLRDPETRHLHRLTVAMASAVLTAATVFLVLVLRWPWTTVGAFSAAFLVPIAVGWPHMGPRRPRH